MCNINTVKQTFTQKKSYGVGAFLLSSMLFAVPHHATAHTISEYILRIEMAPAVCSLDPTQAKRRKCLEGFSLIIKGLYPSPMGQECINHRTATLPPLQARAIARVMPNENDRQQLWRSVGNCVHGNASQYFRQIVTYAERLNIPRLLTAEKSQYVRQQALLNEMSRLNPALPQEAIRLSCQMHAQQKYSVLTEMHICYTSSGLYKSCTTPIANSCPTNFVIEGTY